MVFENDQRKQDLFIVCDRLKFCNSKIKNVFLHFITKHGMAEFHDLIDYFDFKTSTFLQRSSFQAIPVISEVQPEH